MKKKFDKLLSNKLDQKFPGYNIIVKLFKFGLHLGLFFCGLIIGTNNVDMNDWTFTWIWILTVWFVFVDLISLLIDEV